MKRTAFFLLLVLFILSGCTKAPWIVKSDPVSRSVDKAPYSIKITPVIETAYGFTAFDLAIENRTGDDIDLIWDRSYYLQGGQTSGGFLFEGVIYKDRNESKPPDIIFPGQTFRKIIFPSILTSLSKYWIHDVLPNGENGIYVSLKLKGSEVREKLTVNIFAGYDESQRYTTIFGKLLRIE